MKTSFLLRRLLGATLVLASLSSCGSCSKKEEETAAPTATPPVPEVLLTKGKSFEGSKSADMPFKLYQFLSASPENVNYSPLSAEMAFSMAHLGASGATKTTLEKLFGFKSEGAYPFAGEITLANELKKQKSEDAPILMIANSVWTKNPKAVLPAYKKDVEAELEASINPLDAKKINAWVDEHTEHKIQNIIDKLDPNTWTVLVNALYFKAKWSHEFKPANTSPELFQSSTHQTLKVPMMNQTAHFKYFENKYSQWVELPYLKSELSMLLALPTKRYDLRSIEDKLSADLIQEITQKLSSTNVEIKLPKFKFFKKMDLTQTLKGAGYAEIFKGTDYTRFMSKSDIEKLRIDQVLQATSIEVDEKGTEAAAATAIMMEGSGMMLEVNPPKPFYADQPFLFFIRNTKTGEIYFLGRVYNPKENQ